MSDIHDRDLWNEFWNRIGKASPLSRLILLSSIVIVGTSIIMGVFWLGTRSTNASISSLHIPEPSLGDDQSVQGYKYSASDNMQILVQFPGTDYGVYVGKEELKHNNYSASFLYDSKRVIVTGVFDDTFSMYDYYSHAIPSVLDIDTASTYEYTSRVNKKGYLNTFPITYEAGILSDVQCTYYVLSYIYSVDGKKLVMAVITDASDQVSLDWSLRVLRKIFGTFGKLEKNISADESDGALNVKSSDVDEESKLTTDEYMSVLDEKRANEDYAMAYPYAKDFDVNIYVPAELSNKEVCFYFKYTEVNTTPTETYLMSPDGMKYEPSYLNNDKLGLFYYEIDEPISGEWKIHVSANNKYGKYYYDVLERDFFYSTYFGIGKEPEPRIGEE